MAKYNKKWADLFPATIGNQDRPADGVANTLPYETDQFPQHIANDPVRYDKMNAVVSQAMSNDERLNEKINQTSGDLAAHDKNPKAHTTGIAGNAASATKLQTARTLALSGKATGSTTFDGTANANINVTAVTADTASKLSTPRTISLGGNATGSANFDGSNNVTINTTVNQAAHANNADVATKVNATAPNGGAADLVFGAMAGSDFARVRVSGSDDNGWLEIATADNGDEPIYVRQYTGTFTNNVRTAALLDANGNTIFPGNVKAGSFTGSLNGNATTATTAATANKGDWQGKNDDRWYQMAFSLDREFNWQSAGAFQYNPASNVLKVGTVHGNITGNAGSASVAKLIGKDGGTSGGMNFHWSGQGGQPTWLWGGNDGTNMYVYNPANFRVSYATNANSAVNADTVDGYHASDLLRTLAGNKAPVMTDIFDRAGTIDLTAMNATDKANNKAKINKSRNSLQNIWNTSTGIVAYGGDLDMSGGYHHGTLKLTQSYKNFDKILVVGTNDDGNIVFYKLWNVYELIYAFSHSFRFPLYNDGAYWSVYGSVRTGTATDYVLSTDTIWSCHSQGAGIIAIYGIKY